jgi:signal transduction histidine kinase
MPLGGPTGIIIVDDNAVQVKALCDALGGRDFRPEGFTSAAKALEAIGSGGFELLLTDLMMPEMDGISLVRAAMEKDPDLACVLVTGVGTVPTAVEAMKAGALDYILKPYKVSDLLQVLNRALQVRRLRVENALLQESVRRHIAELEEVNRELEAFAFTASHDLRAPLRCIKGFSEMLRSEIEAVLTPDAREYLNRIGEGADAMQRLIDALLNLARVGRHALTPQVVDLTTLVAGVLKDLESEKAGRNVEIRIGHLASVMADPLLLKQVYVNLLSNALKFTARKENALIEIGMDQRGSERIYFVRDNGAGFDMRYAEKLFGIFQRLHSAKQFSGAGVGLSIVQRIVQRHGGHVWAEGKVDNGASFYFVLPEPPAQTSPPPLAATPG